MLCRRNQGTFFIDRPGVRAAEAHCWVVMPSSRVCGHHGLWGKESEFDMGWDWLAPRFPGAAFAGLAFRQRLLKNHHDPCVLTATNGTRTPLCSAQAAIAQVRDLGRLDSS